MKVSFIPAFAGWLLLAAASGWGQSPTSLSRWEAANSLGDQAMQIGEYASARRQFQIGVGLAEGMGNGEQLAVSLTNLGQALLLLNQFAQSGTAYDRAAVLWRKLEGEKQNFALAVAGKAGALEGLGRKREAESGYKRAIAIAETTFGRSHKAVATLLNQLSTFYIAERRFSEAKPLLNRALEIARSVEDPQAVATQLNNLGSIFYAEKRYGEAARVLGEARRIRETELGRDHPDLAPVLTNLGNVMHDQKKFQEAEELYRSAQAINEKAFGPTSIIVAGDLKTLAALYRDMGNIVKAEEMKRRAESIFKKKR